MERIAYDVLYCPDSKGRIKQWQIGAVQEEDGTATMHTKAGLKDGKLKTTKRVVKEGKNIGKSNETTPYQQAVAEAKSKHQKKLDKGYVTDIDDWRQENFPMKASTYRDPDGKKSMEHHIRWPAHATPKLNGLCVIGEPDHLWSKTRKLDYAKACGHLVGPMNELLGMDKIPFHGELYKHGWTLEEINRCGKKYRPGRSEQLELHVYDLVDPGSSCRKRDDELDTIFLGTGIEHSQIVRVPYVLVNNHEEFQELHDKWVADGYEGACIRNIQAKYELDTRSLHLQKYKDGWQDAEFEIIGGKAELQYSGEDNDIEHKCVVYECARKDRPDVTFECRPKGSTEARAKMYKNLANDIGKDLKVRFFSYMESGAPEFPIGLGIRDPE
jgi:DNA ligase-1